MRRRGDFKILYLLMCAHYLHHADAYGVIGFSYDLCALAFLICRACRCYLGQVWQICHLFLPEIRYLKLCHRHQHQAFQQI